MVSTRRFLRAIGRRAAAMLRLAVPDNQAQCIALPVKILLHSIGTLASNASLPGDVNPSWGNRAVTSFCIQYLAEQDAGQSEAIIGSFFIHESPLVEAEHRAAEKSSGFGHPHAFRILDMGGGVQSYRVLDETGGGVGQFLPVQVRP